MLEHLLNSHDLIAKLLCSYLSFAPGAMKVLSTNRDRSIVTFILTQIFSSLSLTNYLGISEILQRLVASELLPFVEVVDPERSSLRQEVELNIIVALGVGGGGWGVGGGFHPLPNSFVSEVRLLNFVQDYFGIR